MYGYYCYTHQGKQNLPAQDQERGLTDSLEDSEKSSDHNERCKVLASSMQGKGSTPEHNVDAEIFGDWETLNEEVRWIFDNKDRNIDTRGEP